MLHWGGATSKTGADRVNRGPLGTVRREHDGAAHRPPGTCGHGRHRHDGQSANVPPGDRPGHRSETHHHESESTMSFWDFLWGTIVIYVGLGFLFLLFLVLRDLFRGDSSGVVKALWVIALVFVPFLSTIVYLIIHGAMDDGS